MNRLRFHLSACHFSISHIGKTGIPALRYSVVVAAEAVTAEALLEVAVRLLLLRVVLVVATVVLIVELLGVLPGLTLGLLTVDVVGALGLGETVDFTASEAGEELLGELVGDGLA